MNIVLRKGFIGVLIVVLAAGIFYSGYSTGFEKGSSVPKVVRVEGVSNMEGGKPGQVDFTLFWEVWNSLKNNHINGGTITNQELLYGAISGAVGALDDPHTVFFPPTDAKKFGEDISGEFSGIGAEIGIRDTQLVVIAPLKNTPAERAGLRSGDAILKINDTSTVGLTVDEAVKLIRGVKGTNIRLTIMRTGFSEPKEFTITRATIQVPTLDWEMKGDIAYLHLYNFYDKAPMLFYQAALQLSFKNPKGIVLDLRNNPGGYLDTAVTLAGWFLPSQTLVVTEEFRSGEKEELKARGSGFYKDIPVVVLINEGSASASEILAGALRDQRNIKLVGEKSFGKGTVQELQNLSNGSLLKVTVAHWRLPKGSLIEKNGLMPDVEVALTEEDIKAQRDPQLEKAIEILKSEL